MCGSGLARCCVVEASANVRERSHGYFLKSSVMDLTDTFPSLLSLDWDPMLASYLILRESYCTKYSISHPVPRPQPEFVLAAGLCKITNTLTNQQQRKLVMQ